MDTIATDHASVYGEHGVFLMKADVDRIQGKGKIDSLLAIREDGKPGILFARQGSRELIELFPLLVLDERRPEDVKKVDGDDPYDTLKYLLTNVRFGEVVKKKRSAKERGWVNPY